MPTTLPTGVIIPALDDPLLPAWPKFVQSLGHIVSVASVAAARAMLSQLEGQGLAPTTAHPFYALIGGILYVTDGSKKGGTWALSVVNEPEFYDHPFSPSGNWGMSPKDHTDLASFTLPVRPYRRRVTATATLWATVTGACDLCVTIGDRRQYARVPAESWGASATVTISAVVSEGQSAIISASAHNFSTATTRVTYGGGDAYNGLTVSAAPISMA